MEHASEEPLDQDVITDLEKRTAALQPGRPEWPEQITDIPDPDFFDN